MGHDGKQSIGALYEDFYYDLFRAAYRMTGDIQEAEDTVNMVFLYALVRAERLATHPNLKGWTMLTLRALIKNKDRLLSNHEISLNSVESLVAPRPDMGLSEILPTNLPQRDKEVLIWRFEQGMDFRDIAEKLGISESGARSCLSRALTRCKELLKSENYAE